MISGGITISTKHSVLDVWQDFEWVSGSKHASSMTKIERFCVTHDLSSGTCDIPSTFVLGFLFLKI